MYIIVWAGPILYVLYGKLSTSNVKTSCLDKLKSLNKAFSMYQGGPGNTPNTPTQLLGDVGIQEEEE